MYFWAKCSLLRRVTVPPHESSSCKRTRWTGQEQRVVPSPLTIQMWEQPPLSEVQGCLSGKTGSVALSFLWFCMYSVWKNYDGFPRDWSGFSHKKFISLEQMSGSFKEAVQCMFICHKTKWALMFGKHTFQKIHIRKVCQGLSENE